MGATLPKLLSIGHSNQPVEEFLALLGRQAIQVVVDVRSRPHSKYAPQFSAPAVERALVGAVLDYLYLGRELGGRPAGAEFYDERGRVLYGRLARSSLFDAGLERLLACAERRRVAVMCSEESPVACHRRLLIGRVLARRGIVLDHLRRDGRVQSEAELETLGSGEPNRV